VRLKPVERQPVLGLCNEVDVTVEADRDRAIGRARDRPRSRHGGAETALLEGRVEPELKRFAVRGLALAPSDFAGSEHQLTIEDAGGRVVAQPRGVLICDPEMALRCEREERRIDSAEPKVPRDGPRRLLVAVVTFDRGLPTLAVPAPNLRRSEQRRTLRARSVELDRNDRSDRLAGPGREIRDFPRALDRLRSLDPFEGLECGRSGKQDPDVTRRAQAREAHSASVIASYRR